MTGEPLPRQSEIEARMKVFEETRRRHAHRRHVGWCSLHEGELREALLAALREPTKHGYCHTDGSACAEPVWCQREHLPTPMLPEEVSVHA